MISNHCQPVEVDVGLSSNDTDHILETRTFRPLALIPTAVPTSETYQRSKCSDTKKGRLTIPLIPGFDERILRLNLKKIIAYIRTMPLNEDRARLLDLLPFILTHFFQTKSTISQLTEEIETRRESLQLYTTNHRCYPAIANDLAVAYSIRFEMEGPPGEVVDLDEAILLYRTVLPLVDYDDPNLLGLLNSLGKSCKSRYERLREDADLDSAIAYYEHALRICPPSRRVNRAVAFYNLANTLYLRFKEISDITVLNQVISYHRQGIALLPSGHPDLFDCHVHLFRALHQRYQILGDKEDMEHSMQHQRWALGLSPNGHPSRIPLLREIGNNHVEYYQEGKVALHIIDDGIGYLSEALRRVTSERAGLSSFDFYVALIHARHIRYKESQDVMDMNESVRLQGEALSSWPINTIRPIPTIRNFGDMCVEYAERQGTELHLNLAIRYYSEVFASIPADHHHVAAEDCQHFTLLLNLAMLYNRRFERFGAMEDLNLTTSYNQRALDMCPEHDPLHAHCLVNTAATLVSRYEGIGNLQDLQDSITHLRTAVELLPSDLDPRKRLTAVTNLASSLRRRFLALGDVDDIEESVEYAAEGVKIAREHEMPDLPVCLHGLAGSQKMRFEQMGDIDDIDSAIALYREALEIFPPGHDASTSTLANLANALDQRHRLLGDPSDLYHTFVLLKRVFFMVRPGHKDFLLILSGLTNVVEFMISAEIVPLDSLDGIVEALQGALKLCPYPHPQRVYVLDGAAKMFKLRAQHRDSAVDLNRAINLYRQALKDGDPKHVEHKTTSGSLAHALRIRFLKGWGGPSDLDEAVSMYRKAEASLPSEHPDSGVIGGSLGDTLVDRSEARGSQEDLDEGLACYQRAANTAAAGSSLCFSTAQRWASAARKHDHSSTLQAYSTWLSLLDRFVTISDTIQSQHKRLADIPRSIALNAASFAISKNRLEIAVELLEQGRAILWAQVGRYRTPLDRLKEKHPVLAVEFRRLSLQLEKQVVTVEREVEDASNYRALSMRLEEVIARIRSMKGFSGFLRSTPFTKLQRAATNGPVVIVNIDEHRSDVLIVQHNVAPILIPLDHATPEVVTSLAARLNTALSPHGDVKIKTFEVTAILRSLWDLIVHPVVRRLKGECGMHNGSRIWWCPTSALWSLPLHAAGPYKKGERNLPDIFTSSYTPTLSALLRAMDKQADCPNDLPQTLLVVGQAQAPGLAPLNSVPSEIEQARESVPSVKILDGENATSHTVIRGLQDCSWVHFACHGHQDLNHPFNAHFSLHDGPLTLLDIIQSDLPQAEFAFLSACHSAAGDRNTPNEAIHLAAGLQFSGFGGVVGTMWSMADVDGPVITKEFYKHMFRDGRTRADLQDAAEGLNLATKALRRMRVPVERWINFIHIGA